MKTFQTLIKLQKTKVDDQRIQLTRLQSHVENLDRQITELEISKAREQATAQENPDARMTYGAFLAGAIKKGRELDRAKEAAVSAVEIARGQLAELFEEQKRYEIADAQRIEEAAAKEKQRETQMLDEIGSIAHQRKKD